LAKQINENASEPDRDWEAGSFEPFEYSDGTENRRAGRSAIP
jgi:hypothetical protein